MAPVFRALADPVGGCCSTGSSSAMARRSASCARRCPAMTRFGVMKHLGRAGGGGPRDDPARSAARSATSSTRCRSASSTTAGSASSPSRSSGRCRLMKRTLEAPMDTDRPRLRRLHQGGARAGLARDHRRRRHRPLLLRHARRLDLGGRAHRSPTPIPDGSRRGRRRWSSRSSRAGAVVMAFHAALGPRDRGRGPGPDDLGGRGRRRRRPEADGDDARSSPARGSRPSSPAASCYIVSGLKTILETGRTDGGRLTPRPREPEACAAAAPIESAHRPHAAR